MQLTFDTDVEAFRAEFVAFLDENLPADDEALERSRIQQSCTRVGPALAAADVRQRLAAARDIRPSSAAATPRSCSSTSTRRNCARRRAYLTFNPQGVGIISASLISFGTPEQQRRWAIPILRAEMTASLGMSEPGAGSDLASLRTRADVDGDEFVVNGQKVWTSGAHDADVLLTFVRTDPNAAKHKGISVLMIPTDLPGVVRRPFASVCDQDDVDFNEVFFNDVRVPAENLVGSLNEGWQVASGSLGHERNMLWLSYADRLEELVEDFRPSGALDRDRYAALVMDNQALRLLGSVALSRAARGEEDVAALSVLKLFGSEASQAASEYTLAAAGADALASPNFSGPYSAHHLDLYRSGWFERYVRTFGGTIAGGTSEIQRNIIAQRLLGLPRN